MNKRVKFALLATLVVAITATMIGVMVLRAQALPDGVRPVVWDKESCGECGMAVSDQRFAAQLQTDDGQVINFDDPGCLFIYLIRSDPSIHAVYFHALDGDIWLNGEQVGFVPTLLSPMGYDLAAVPRGTPGSLTFAETLEKIRTRHRSGG
jgi:copper chaperone NosL